MGYLQGKALMHSIRAFFVRIVGRTVNPLCSFSRYIGFNIRAFCI
jgi:hypothetical protein